MAVREAKDFCASVTMTDREDSSADLLWLGDRPGGRVPKAPEV